MVFACPRTGTEYSVPREDHENGKNNRVVFKVLLKAKSGAGKENIKYKKLPGTIACKPPFFLINLRSYSTCFTIEKTRVIRKKGPYEVIRLICDI